MAYWQRGAHRHPERQYGWDRTAVAVAYVVVNDRYTWTYRDAHGAWLDAARSYRLHLPGPVPAKNFLSVVVYDLWTRSTLANGQRYPMPLFPAGSEDDRLNETVRERSDGVTARRRDGPRCDREQPHDQRQDKG